MKTALEIVMAGLGADKEFLLERMETRVFPENSLILKEGDTTDLLFIILEGRVKTFVVDPIGVESVLSIQGAGEYFGNMGFIADRAISSSVITVEPSQIAVIRTEDLKTLMRRNNDFAMRVFAVLVHQLEQQSRELSEVFKQKTAIGEVLRVSNTQTDLQAVLDIVSENAARLCDVTNAEIFKVQGDELHLVANRGLHRIRSIGFSIKISRDLVIGRAVIDRTSIHVHDLQAADVDFPLGATYARQYKQHTVFATPLLRDGIAIGVIIISRLEVKPLTDRQISLLKTFADQAAIAIEHVRLYSEIAEKGRKLEEQAKELATWNSTLESRVAEQVLQLERLSKLEHELSLASEIQKSMLPSFIPKLDGYQFGARMIPAKFVGGDFFDFIPMGGDSLGIAIGDVSDKGIPAALFMAMVRSLLRAETHIEHSSKEVLQRVNRHLMSMNDKEMFATVLFGILDRTTRQFHYARAGHESPILWDGQDTIMRMPKGNGRALGVFEDIDLVEQIITIPIGGVLLLYSDGLSDAINPQKVSFGCDGIYRIIRQSSQSSAHEICDELVNAVAEHQQNSSQHDDVTIVIARAV